MDKIEKGAYQVVNNCLRIKKDEKVVIITDYETKEIACKIEKKAKEITNNIQVFIMEKFGKRDDIKNPIKFPLEIEESLKEANVSLYVAKDKPGELQTFRSPMLKVVNENNNLRHAHMPGVDEILMQTGMQSNYEKIHELSKKVFDIVKNSKKIKVTTNAGTNFIASFSNNIKWLISDGIIKNGSWGNLPDGEVFTCVENINGLIVVDGILGDFYDKKYGLINKTPLSIEVKNGKITNLSCLNKDIENDIKAEIKKDENSNRIGEFAIGTNFELKELVGNMLQDEKFPGIHVAIGHGYPEETGSKWDSEVHIDCVIKKPTIIVDDNLTIMKDGKFII